MSSARVPKFTIITGGSYGAGYLAMLGRPFQPDAMFAWPTGRSAIMGPEQAASVLAQVRAQILASIPTQMRALGRPSGPPKSLQSTSPRGQDLPDSPFDQDNSISLSKNTITNLVL